MLIVLSAGSSCNKSVTNCIALRVEGSRKDGLLEIMAKLPFEREDKDEGQSFEYDKK